MVSTLPGLLAITLYLLASMMLVRRLVSGAEAPGCQRAAILLDSISAAAVHGAFLYPDILQESGLNLGFFYAASLVALTAVLLLLLASITEPVENLGIGVFPLAALSVGLVMAWPEQHMLTSSSAWQLDTHILTSLLAYSVLGLAVAQAALLAIQDRHLQNRKPGGFIRALPPLQVMENLLFQMIVIGFTLLTLSLVTGVLFLEDIFSQHLVHKTALSFMAWLVFGILLWGRWRFGWRGRTAIRWTIGGFIFLMLAYFGSKFVLELVLSR